MRRVLVCAIALSCLAAPSWSQGADSDSTAGVKAGEKKDSSVEFLDSSDAYWVTKGFNDTLYGGGSVNSVRLERNQFRNDEMLKKIYKPTKIVEVTINGKVQPPSVPTLKMNGKEVKVP